VEIPNGEGKYLEANFGKSSGVESHRTKPLLQGGGMDIFRNYIIKDGMV